VNPINQLAAKLWIRPYNDYWTGLTANYNRYRSDGTNHPSRESLRLTTRANYSYRDLSLSLGAGYLREKKLRGGENGLGTTKDRGEALAEINFNFDYNFRLVAYSSLRLERVDRSFSGRDTKGRRDYLENGVKGSWEHYSNNFGANLWLQSTLLHDRLGSMSPFTNRKERLGMAVNKLWYHPGGGFEMELYQRYRRGRLGERRYLPELALTYSPLDYHYIVLRAGRAGAYRNPLLNDDHLSYTLRTHDLAAPLRTEDFWRYGVKIVGNVKRQYSYYVQAVHRDYQRYTTVSYSPDDRLVVGQQGDVQRTTVAAEVNARLLEHSERWTGLMLSINYRYDKLEAPVDEGMLLPARHALWTRATQTFALGGDPDLALQTKVGYLWVAGLEPPGTETSLPAARTRLDVSARLRYKRNFVALRGEQLLRDQPLYGAGLDGASGLPLGSEFATLGGRWVTLTFGVGLP